MPSNIPEKSGIHPKPESVFYSIDWPQRGLRPNLRKKAETAIIRAIRSELAANTDGQMSLFTPSQLRRSREDVDLVVSADHVELVRSIIEESLGDAEVRVDPKTHVIQISAGNDNPNARAS